MIPRLLSSRNKTRNLTQEFTFFWNGKDNEKNLVANGVYEVKVTAIDRAGNESFIKIQVIVCGAEYGNRTRTSTLGRLCSTIKLIPPTTNIIAKEPG